MNDLVTVKDCQKIKDMIIENPDLPIVVLASCETNTGDYEPMYCSDVSCFIDEILDCQTPFDSEITFNDREHFEECLIDYLESEYYSLDRTSFDDLLKRYKEKYEPYWKKVITVYVGN